MIIRNVGFAVLALGVLTAGTAFASPQGQTRSVSVSYTPGALESPDGAQRLYHRIQAAAREACGDSDPRDLVRYFLFKGCYQSAVDSAVQKVDATRLTALHRKTQRTSPG